MSKGMLKPDKPWEHEPDEWRGKRYGLAVFARRNPVLGNWCGYVALPDAHPWRGKNAHDLADVNVHGGVTMSGTMAEYGASEVWMVGFDCAHAIDSVPKHLAMVDYFPRPRPSDIASQDGWGTKYRTLQFVQDQLDVLARQAAVAAI